ncbi:hypothetical protein CE91St61_30900 [Lachnospiraceae bacterium]|nr:hypothetical protein CE91St61_30900 [Lachnospiraceae bacterium]
MQLSYLLRIFSFSYLNDIACGMRAAIGEHPTGLGICVIAAVPGRIEASAPYLPSGALLH